MKKDKFEKPIIAENPTDTVMVNAGEEITDNVVQKEEIMEDIARESFETDAVVTPPDDISSMSDEIANNADTFTEDSGEDQSHEVGEVADSLTENGSNSKSVEDAETDSVTEDGGNNQTHEVGEVADSSTEDDGNSQRDEVPEVPEESIEERTGRTLSPGRLVLKRFFRSKLSMTGLVVLIILFIFSFIGPLFDFLPFIWGEKEADNSNSVREEYTAEVEISADGDYCVYDRDSDAQNKVYVVTYSYPSNYLKPSKTHLLGTDDKGYDIFSRLMYGGRISLTIGFVVIILETVIGVILGGLAGYFGKWVDQLIMRIVDIFNCVPTLPMLMIAGVALEKLEIYGPSRLYILMAMMTLFGWAGTARLVRGQILSLREQDFMLSAEASGLTVGRKIFKHLIPNVIPQLIVSMTLGLGSIILTEATLGYLNIGLPDEYATWGNMINAAANDTALRLYPNLWISPGICIVLAVLAFNFIGDGLRDAFDPKARR